MNVFYRLFSHTLIELNLFIKLFLLLLFLTNSVIWTWPFGFWHQKVFQCQVSNTLDDILLIIFLCFVALKLFPRTFTFGFKGFSLCWPGVRWHYRCHCLLRCWMYRELSASWGISFVSGTWGSCCLQLGENISSWSGEIILV